MKAPLRNDVLPYIALWGLFILLIKLYTMGLILKSLYRIFLMPYLERDRYFDELLNETETECNIIALKEIIKNGNNK